MDTEQSNPEEGLSQKILTMRAADIRPAHYVSLPKPRRFFHERFEKFWDYRSEINELFDRLFPGMETTVVYRFRAEDFYGHVFVKKPNEQNPYYVLFTAGMSHMPMRIPKSLKARRANLERAELFMLLPTTFHIGTILSSYYAHEYPWEAGWLTKLSKCYWRFRFGDRLYMLTYSCPWDEIWPLDWLKKMAKFPHKEHSWISNRFVYNNGASLAPCLTFQGFIFLHFGELAARNGQQINLYGCVPLYPEEIEYLHPRNRETTEQERREAYDRILKDLPLIVDLKRLPLHPSEAKNRP